jgi:hypothetical protein
MADSQRAQERVSFVSCAERVRALVDNIERIYANCVFPTSLNAVSAILNCKRLHQPLRDCVGANSQR